MSLDATIMSLRAELSAAIAAAADEGAIEAVRVAALGKKGSVSALLQSLGSMDPEARKAAGAAINALKTEITALIETKASALARAALDARLKAERVDVTLPVRAPATAEGRIHPIIKKKL